MSHARYSFLIQSDEPVSRLTDDGCREIAVMEYDSYAESHCDENNWHTHCCLVTRDQRVLMFNDQPNEGWFLQEQDKFAAAIRFAAGCIAGDANLFGLSGWSLGTPKPEQQAIIDRVEAMGTGDLLQAIHDELQAYLAQAYASLAPPTGDGRFDLEDYQRKTRSVIFEELRGVLSRKRKYTTPPFGYPKSPYDHFRAMDLTSDEHTGEREMILITDIHT